MRHPPSSCTNSVGASLFTSPKGLLSCPIYIKSGLQSIYLSQSIYI
ncbi:hypothetical protein HMPREF1554_01643 [Porphyromonas gingivalis F0569]|nr:hypothetical protein HMPREF1554_01643 [Porphyromonas gingivalis F0569]